MPRGSVGPWVPRPARQAGRRAIKLPSEYLKDIYADSLTHDPAAVRYLVERLGQDQIVLGSDHPFDMGEADPVGKVKEAIDDPEIVQKILGGTAERLLNLA